jgi:thioredoxin reductase (NADPH)
MSAAIWLRRLHVGVRLLDRASRPGGELLRVNLPIEDYPGLVVADGRALADELVAHLGSAGVPVELGVEVESVDLTDRVLATSSGAVQFSALVVATGLKRQTLDVPGEDAYRGRGVSYSATTDLAAIAGHEVVVVGGGDGAYENAHILAGACPRVTIAQRGAEARARPALVARCLEAGNVTVLAEHRVVEILVDGRRVTGVRAVGPSGERRIPTDWVVVKIGFAPVTGFLGGQLAAEPGGHIRVDRAMRTSAPGVFAAGDVANAFAPSVAAAVGDGAVAARGVLEYLLSATR